MIKEYAVGPNLQEIIAQDFPEKEFKIDKELYLYDSFVPLLKQGVKKTTIRYGRDKIRIPASNKLILYESTPSDKDYKKEIGYIEIPNIKIKPIKEITEEDAIKDGFSGKSELMRVIKDIYGEIPAENLVSIYEISLKDNS